MLFEEEFLVRYWRLVETEFLTAGHQAMRRLEPSIVTGFCRTTETCPQAGGPAGVQQESETASEIEAKRDQKMRGDSRAGSPDPTSPTAVCRHPPSPPRTPWGSHVASRSIADAR